MAADGSPVILSANVTRGLGGKTSFAATVKNVFKETASTSGMRPTQQKSQRMDLPERLVEYPTFKSSCISGSGAQARRQQQAVCRGGGASAARRDWDQDARTDGAEGLTVELRAQAQIWRGRWL